MNTFKKKALFAAMSGVAAIGVSGAAQAVHVNPDGLGHVLVYPYYTVRQGNDTYMSVINTTNSVKAVKVRILEGKNSREVLDFNLYLSPYDVWVAAVSATADGAQIQAFDKSCTDDISVSSGTKIPFVNYAYTGTNADTGDTSLDRTREGYFEMIDMGVVTTASLVTAATHVSGVPNNCAALRNTAASDLAYNTAGGLAGSASLINVGMGTEYGYDPVAVDGWATSPVFSGPGFVTPQLVDGNVSTANAFIGGSLVSAVFPNTLAGRRDANSAVLVHNRVMNEYALGGGLGSLTSWIVTFPTKRFYVNPPGTGAAIPPFTELFGSTADGKSCDVVDPRFFNREEQTINPTSVRISPPPPGPAAAALCYEANVINFKQATTDPTLFGSTNNTDITLPSTFTAGWGWVAFTQTTMSLTNGTITFRGLPVVGFMARDLVNNTLVVGGTNVLSNYGGNWIHKYGPGCANPPACNL